MISLSLAAVTPLASAQNATNILENSSTNNSVLNMTPSMNKTNNMQVTTTPKIVGSISTMQAAKNLLNENVKVTLADASSKAASQVNGSAVGGHLGIVQGYLV